MNNNGVIDDPGDDFLVDTAAITGPGTVTITVSVFGPYVIRELPVPGWEPNTDQPVYVSCDEHVYFHNRCIPCTGQIEILKLDELGAPLFGATFEICPNPKTGEEPCLIVEDNGLNDEDPAGGVLLVTGVKICVPVTVTETVPPPDYELDPTPYPAHVTECGETVVVTVVNIPPEGLLIIRKVDESGNFLADACFEITPDPRTCEGSLILCDNDANDEDSTDGVFLLTGLEVCCPFTVIETVAPAGYELDPTPQPGHVTVAGEIVELTFVNTRELDCGTVCAAQTGPGEFLFSSRQSNWFTWIYYDIGSGTAASPYTYPIYVGQTTLCGTLYVYDDGTHIFVNYDLTDTATCALAGLSDYHLQVDETFDDLYKNVVKGKNPVPGKCEYQGYFDPMVSETGYIECTDDDISGWTTAYIFAHGVGCFICP
jgi:hypothetical protein